MSGTAVVELRDATLGYDESDILSGVDLRIDAGEIVSIIGGSGSGKSTLLRAMTGLLQPHRGVVRLFGEDLYRLTTDARGRLLSRVGLLFQHGALFGSMSVLQNVMFPAEKLTDLPSETIRELAWVKLALLGVEGLADRLPRDISGGQAKRVALARATVLDPELLLCDEPTAGLDPISSEALGRLLLDERDAHGTTLILVTHDIPAVERLSDRTFVVGDGGIKASGPPSELKRSPDEHVRALFAITSNAASQKSERPTV